MKPFADHFSRLAPAYASWRPRYPEALFDYLASLVTSRDCAWDCAAGSGQASIPLASRFRHVIATDISASMISQAPSHPGVHYRVAPAQASGLGNETMNLVTVAQALHWLDTDEFYAEARRVLMPGGVLAVWTYGLQTIDGAGLDRELARFYSHVVGPYWPPERAHVEAGYRTLAFPFTELDPPSFGMKEYWTLSQLLEYLRTWSATVRFRELVGSDPVDGLRRELATHWGDPTSVRQVSWPLSLRVGRRP